MGLKQQSNDEQLLIAPVWDENFKPHVPVKFRSSGKPDKDLTEKQKKCHNIHGDTGVCRCLHHFNMLRAEASTRKGSPNAVLLAGELKIRSQTEKANESRKV